MPIFNAFNTFLKSGLFSSSSFLAYSGSRATGEAALGPPPDATAMAMASAGFIAPLGSAGGGGGIPDLPCFGGAGGGGSFIAGGGGGAGGPPAPDFPAGILGAGGSEGGAAIGGAGGPGGGGPGGGGPAGALAGADGA